MLTYVMEFCAFMFVLYHPDCKIVNPSFDPGRKKMDDKEMEIKERCLLCGGVAAAVRRDTALLMADPVWT